MFIPHVGLSWLYLYMHYHWLPMKNETTRSTIYAICSVHTPRSVHTPQIQDLKKLSYSYRKRCKNMLLFSFTIMGVESYVRWVKKVDFDPKTENCTCKVEISHQKKIISSKSMIPSSHLWHLLKCYENLLLYWFINASKLISLPYFSSEIVLQ